MAKKPKPVTPTARFKYKNWEGKVSIRHVLPLTIYWASNEWHKEPQWLLNAYCFEKAAARTFAMKDISEWENVT